ncbi:MAG: spore coat U domain-containing protein [Sphingopyxis sp.]|nr:spore coat U domain-containing protein [Sphingopyxis sp.]
MPTLKHIAAILLSFVATMLAPTAASACTTATTSTNIGSFSSYAVAAGPQQGSGSAGLQCDILLAALTAHYVRLRVEASTFTLVGPTGQTIAYTASLTSGGTPLAVGNVLDLSSLSLVSLFSGTSNSVPIFFRTSTTAGLRAGTYSGFIDLRWYYSVCSVGVAVCLSYSSSPGLIRPALGPVTNWGTGVPVRVNVELKVENDCVITAPNVAFGSAPLAASFNPVTRTILIRCSAGAAYTVGLNDGDNAVGGVRRMRSGTNYLRYEIYKTAASTDRWGGVGTARRSSASADTNAGIYDSATTQGYTYRAAILPGQTAIPVGDYNDRIRIDVVF